MHFMKIVESKGEEATDFASSIIVRAKNGKESLEVEGAIFAAKHPRIVRVNSFYLEAVPEGHILVLQNKDVPGVVGAVGTILGKHGLNIAGMAGSRPSASWRCCTLASLSAPRLNCVALSFAVPGYFPLPSASWARIVSC